MINLSPLVCLQLFAFWATPRSGSAFRSVKKDLLLALVGEEHGVDVGEDTTGGDGDGAEELGELLIVADRQLDVAGHDAGLLVVAGGVAGELENLSGEVLEDGSEVHGGTGTDAGGVLASLEVARDAADGELKARLGGAEIGRAHV